jgi:5-methyltetrahydrofolate--homocysteine methyltransferase
MTRDGLIGSARQMRKAPTEAERVLWQALRRKGVEGMRFRRQRVIGPYIVDFCCLEHRIIVEVDGSHHLAEEVTAYDEERTRYLETYGFRVLRFKNREILRDIDSVIAQIASMKRGVSM